MLALVVRTEDSFRMPKLYAIREFVWPIWILQSIFKNALCNCHSFIRIFFLIFWTSEFCKWMEASIEREQRYRILSSQSQVAENTYLLYVALKQLILVRSIRYAIHNLFIYLCNCHSFIHSLKKKKNHLSFMTIWLLNHVLSKF